jgi:sugar/nucleoside kinase (ribokinase family)
VYEESFENNTFQRFFGGSPSNIAMNVKKLGNHSLVASAVGKDGFGKFLINLMSIRRRMVLMFTK